MRRDTALFRLAVLAACSGLAAFGLPRLALAQATGGILPDTTTAAEPEVNPPALVGALIGINGAVSFHAADADQWDQAVLNYPITSGEGLWTQPDAHARISIGDALLGMAGATDFEVDTLDDTGLVATLPEGEVYLHVRSLFPGQTLSFVTPRGSVTIAEPGRYDIVAGTTDSPTVISVLEGAAALGEGAAGTVQAGQAAVITGQAVPFQVQVAAAQPTPFVAEMMQLEQPRPVAAASVAPPPLVATMPGGEELQAYGTWSQSPEYGEVWYPRVASGWVPYREGHWAYVAPWGWTWVDSDPWGFAPFHYGRWAEIGGRWGWIPGGRRVVAEAPAYPVYAPALVTFFGAGVAAGATAALLSSGHVGWVPLGPHEVYRPWFHASPHYIRNVNIRHVTNITQINTVINNRTVNNITINRFRNVRGATVVPAAAMATSRPIRAVARRPDAQTLRTAHAVYGRQPLRPTTATLGVTPRVARQVHAVALPAGVAVEHRRAAPGPAIRHPAPRTARPAGATARRPATRERPSLRPPAAHAAAPAARPQTARPAGRPEIHATPHAEHAPVRPAARATPRATRPATRPEVHAAPRVEHAPARPAARATPQAARPAARPEVHPAPPVEHAPAARPAVRSAPQAARPAPRPEVHAAPRVEHAPARPAARAVPHPAARPQVHAAPRVEHAPARPAARPEAHAAPRVEHAPPRPAAHAAPRPAPHAAPHPEAHRAQPHPAAHAAPQHEKRPGER